MTSVACEQGPAGSRVSLLIVRQDDASGINMPPVDVVLTRRRWVEAGTASAPCQEVPSSARDEGARQGRDHEAGQRGVPPLEQPGPGLHTIDHAQDEAVKAISVQSTRPPPPPPGDAPANAPTTSPSLQELQNIFKTLDKNHRECYQLKF